jgi:hypothetical protein
MTGAFCCIKAAAIAGFLERISSFDIVNRGNVLPGCLYRAESWVPWSGSIRWLGCCSLGVVLTLGSLTASQASAQTAALPNMVGNKVQDDCDVVDFAITAKSPPWCDHAPFQQIDRVFSAMSDSATPGDATQTLPPPDQWSEGLTDEAMNLASVQRVDVDPAIIENSPVLQRWLEEVPNLAVDVNHDPAFRTRVRLGYAEFPSTDNTSGIYVGVQDVFVGRTPLTLSADYATNGRGDRQEFGVDAQYYLLPLGWYGNVAPVVGYRDIQTSAFESSGLNLGLRVVVIPSRTGTADLSVTQSWVAPGTDREVGLTTFTAGYAIAEDLRIGTDIQIQNTRDRQESRLGLLLEWML